MLVTGFVTYGSPAFADGQVQIDDPAGHTQTYPGVTVIDTPSTVYLREENAHQTMIVHKGTCAAQNGLSACTKVSVVWDRYGVQTPIDVRSADLYVNRSSQPHLIAGSNVTLTPNTLALKIVTPKGSTITAMGYIDSTSAAGR
jgi:hypothetical protein